jgi:hypothetical protein
MKTVLRSLLYLALIVWLGAEVFFPIVAAITFNTLHPDTHTAGQIVGHLLRILHYMGLVSGMVLLALLALAPAFGVFRPRIALAAMAPIILMIALTSFSQFVILPSMERDRIAAGGAIDTANPDNSITAHFNRLHNRSENVEGAILLLGLVSVVLIAIAETRKP